VTVSYQARLGQCFCGLPRPRHACATLLSDTDSYWGVHQIVHQLLSLRKVSLFAIRDHKASVRKARNASWDALSRARGRFWRTISLRVREDCPRSEGIEVSHPRFRGATLRDKTELTVALKASSCPAPRPGDRGDAPRSLRTLLHFFSFLQTAQRPIRESNRTLPVTRLTRSYASGSLVTTTRAPES
jgi:hypothetical protein